MGMQQQLTIPQWLSLPQEVRNELKQLFGIPRSSGTYVLDGVVQTDGYTHPDLATITVEKMQVYLGSTDKDFFGLFDQVVEKVYEKLAKEAAALVAEMEAEQEELAKQQNMKAVEAINNVAALAGTVLTPTAKLAKVKKAK